MQLPIVARAGAKLADADGVPVGVATGFGEVVGAVVGDGAGATLGDEETGTRGASPVVPPEPEHAGKASATASRANQMRIS